jgi:hypothetical protein
MLEDLTAPPSKIWTCRVRTLATELEKKDQDIFWEAVSNPQWKAETLSKALNQKGLKIAGSGITRHRQGNCSCSKI